MASPIIAMNLDDFLIEVASNTEDGDKGLRTIAKEIQKRYNRYPLLVAFIQHLGNLSDPAEMEDFIANNWEDVMEDKEGEPIDEEIPFINNPDIF